MSPSYRPKYSWPSIDARTPKEAAEKLKKLMKERPDLFIQGATDNATPKHVPLWRRLLTGE